MTDPPPNRAAMIVLAYLWLLAVIPLLIDREDQEVQWHAKHGLVLMAAEIVLFLLLTVGTAIVSLATFGAGCVVGLLGVFIWVAIIGVHVAAIVKGINGTRLIVPGVSAYASRF